MPMSSMSSTLALPAPGPSTVRLALVRTALELFGESYARNEVFPIVRSMPVLIRPPDQIAMSRHLLRGYKGNERSRTRGVTIQESIVSCEVTHAMGLMTIYSCIPRHAEEAFADLFRTIGYWGKADSFACCTEVRRDEPDPLECVRPLSVCTTDELLRPYFTAFAAEFAQTDLSWEALIAQPGNYTYTIKMMLFVWPMVRVRQHLDGKTILHRKSAPCSRKASGADEFKRS
jgi:hypothetical protein